MKRLKKIYNMLPPTMKKVLKRILKPEKKDNTISKEKFIQNLLRYDVISFDIFDTLITRKIFSPDDIFNIMEEKIIDIELKDSILNMRKKAEESARKKLKKDVNIDEIYFELGRIYNYDEKTINQIKGVEVDLEYKLTCPRKDMLDILKKLASSGKKVVLTSDMYLNKHIITKMLNICGYNLNEHYHKIYLSNELNKRKDDGSMWKYMNILYKGLKYIHVGDNRHSDYNMALSNGFPACLIENPREQLSKKEYFNGINEYIDKRTNADSLFLGYIINMQIFNSPFKDKIDSVNVLAKVLIAPMIHELCCFINSNTKSDEHLLFLAREGYYLESLYKEYCKIFGLKEKKHSYFLTSRKATTSAIIGTQQDVEKSINKEYTGTIKTFMKNLFDIDYKGEDTKIKLPEEYDKVLSIVKNYGKEIIAKSLLNKKAYMKYINSIFDYTKDPVVIVDLGYSGTIQYSLSKMLSTSFKGIYLTNSDTVKRYDKNSKLLFAFDVEENEKYKTIYHYSLILEYFLSAPYGQLQYFKLSNGDAKPIYNNEVIDEHKKMVIEEIYTCVTEYMTDMYELNSILKPKFKKELLWSNYTSIIESNLIDRKVKDEFIFMDAFNDSEKRNVFKIIDRY